MIIASAELADVLSWLGVRTHAMSIGGAYQLKNQSGRSPLLDGTRFCFFGF